VFVYRFGLFYLFWLREANNLNYFKWPVVSNPKILLYYFPSDRERDLQQAVELDNAVNLEPEMFLFDLSRVQSVLSVPILGMTGRRGA
jgi:hypothetical protein